MDLKNILGSKTFDEVKSWAKENKLRYSEDGKLFLLSNTKNSDTSLAHIKQANGVIMEKDTNDLVALSTIVPHRYPDSAHETPDNLDGQTVYECREGVQLRIFNHEDTWRLSTMKKIHASESKFTSSRSFADLFWEVATDLDLETLNKTYCYTLILEHVENVNTFQVKENTISLMCVTDKEGKNVPDVQIANVRSISTVPFTTKEEVIKTAQELPYENVGLVIMDRATGDRTIILSDEYKDAQRVRGHGPDLLYRCLATYLKGNPEDFLKYHPRSQTTFNHIDQALSGLTDRVYFAYRSRHVFKKQFTVDQNTHMILKHLHKDFLESGDSYESRVPLDREKVKAKILGYSPMRLHAILKGSENKGKHNQTNPNKPKQNKKGNPEPKEQVADPDTMDCSA